jgi:hypothetical protein
MKLNRPDTIFRADRARLIEEAMDARLRALWLGPSAERDWLIREARYCEAVAHGVDWATSKGLQPPR